MRAATLSLSLVAPQGFDHYAPLSAVELQLPALTGSIFLQAGVYLCLDRLDLGAHRRLAHDKLHRCRMYRGSVDYNGDWLLGGKYLGWLYRPPLAAHTRGIARNCRPPIGRHALSSSR